MDYDEILEELGQFTKWHLLQVSLLWLFAITGAFATLCYSFTGKLLCIRIKLNNMVLIIDNLFWIHFKTTLPFRAGAGLISMYYQRMR